MATAPLLYVCVRPQLSAAQAEYASFLRASGLSRSGMGEIDLVRERLPENVFDEYSGFLIGGSPFNLTDPEPTKTDAQRLVEHDLERIAERAAAGQTAALFACYGIGIVTRMLGGSVTRGYPEDTGPVTIDLTEAGTADPVFGMLRSPFQALTAHKEGAGQAPPSSVLLASNLACPVQAYRVGERLYATQFHPEPTTRAFTERMAIYRDDGYFESAAFDEIAARVMQASVTEPARALYNFTRRFGPPQVTSLPSAQ